MKTALDRRETSGLFFWHPISEGLFPERTARLIKHFQLEAQGYGTEFTEPTEIDGEHFCLREFEEPGDWPDKIRAADDVRRRKEMGERYVSINPLHYLD